MREYVLTELERNIIHKNLQTGEKLEGYRVLQHRCQKLNPTTIKNDLQLITQFLNHKVTQPRNTPTYNEKETNPNTTTNPKQQLYFCTTCQKTVTHDEANIEEDFDDESNDYLWLACPHCNRALTLKK